MMQVLSTQQMRGWEQAVMTRHVPSRVLMELAAKAVTDVVRGICQGNGSVAVCCGGGNNGGDGLACARQLRMHGIDASVILIAPPETLKGDALENYRACKALGVPITVLGETDAFALRPVVIVDALFGTGLSRDIEGSAKRLIGQLNSIDAPIVSVDIPSGIDADIGAVRGAAIRADYTVTFQHPKPGHLLMPGRSHTGALTIAPLAPREDIPGAVQWLEQSDIARLLPPRKPDAHKGDHGHLLLIAGSEATPGAAIMAAMAALRSGCGLLTVALPRSARNALLAHCPEAMTLPLSTSGGEMDVSNLPALEHALLDKSCVAIGPGFGRGAHAQALVKHILRFCEIPILADADALFAISKELTALNSTAPIVVTPHPGEMARLCEANASEIARSPMRYASAFARQHKAVVHLKGATSVTADPTGQMTLTTAGNAGLAKGGSGDVLSGIIAAFMAQGLGAYDAARLGALTLGFAADAAVRRTGERGLMARDVIGAMADVIG